MRVYRLHRKQHLNISLEEAWKFFSSPYNLKHITPDHMNFDIRFMTGGEEMYAGQLIHYRVNILPFVRVKWTTEITHVDAPNRFVDEQRFGPYAMWHHEHRFRQHKNGVMMEDEVTYSIPLGFIGTIANALFVRRQVEGIFDYRFKVLEEKFNNRK